MLFYSWLLEGLAISQSPHDKNESGVVITRITPEEEASKILEELSPQELATLQKVFRVLSDNVGDDMASKLMDVEDEMERSSSPNIGFVFLQVYLRTGADYFGKENPVGKKFLKLANYIAKAMIPYKDKRLEKLAQILQKVPENVQITNNPMTQPESKPRMRDQIFNKPKEGEF